MEDRKYEFKEKIKDYNYNNDKEKEKNIKIIGANARKVLKIMKKTEEER